MVSYKALNTEAGSGYYGLPVMKSFTFGLNITL